MLTYIDQTSHEIGNGLFLPVLNYIETILNLFWRLPE